MRQVSWSELVEVMRELPPRAKFVMVAQTKPAVKARGPLRGKEVLKLAKVAGRINWNYGKRVNAGRLLEDKPTNFVSAPRQWGRHAPGSPIVTHDGKVYLWVEVERCLGCEYFVNGTATPVSEVEPHLRAKGRSRQGLTEEVVARCYALQSVISVEVDGGETYIIDNAVAVE